MTMAKATKPVASFDEQIKHARELVVEGHRLLHVANRDLKAGRNVVRRTQQLLAETESVFRAKRRRQATAGSIGLAGTPPASIASPAAKQRSSL
ncbi:hypothetical protein BH10PSE10_BH10PSE10_00380 [soil metagenome]